MIQRILDWIDEAAGGLIRLTYLLAGITAVAVYFGAGALPAYIEAPLNAMLPWLLAFSVETHTYLTMRRVSRAWFTLQAPALEATTKQTVKTDMWVNLGILAMLVSFSIFNQFNYNLSIWVPTENPIIPVPPLIQYIVRSSIIPLFFMAAAFLAKQADTVGETVNAEAHHTLRKFLGVIRKQTRRSLKTIEKKTGLQMGDAIKAVAGAAGEPKAGQMIAVVQGAIASLEQGVTPSAAASSAMQAEIIPVTSTPETPEQRARKVWRKGMGAAELSRLAKIAPTTAKRYVRRFNDEQAMRRRGNIIKLGA